MLFLANSDDQSSGQRLSDSELLVKGTLSVLGTADAPVVLSSSNAVGCAVIGAVFTLSRTRI